MDLSETCLPPHRPSLSGGVIITVIAFESSTRRDLHTIGMERTVVRMTKAKQGPKPAAKSSALQRTYRFHRATFEAFEEDCARYFSNPKRVIEALILHWLAADQETRDALSRMYREKLGDSRDE